MDNIKILITKPEKDYELLDSGEGEKLERFGNIVLSRPDPQALWNKRLDDKEWKLANAHFSREGNDGKWNIKGGSDLEKWSIDFAELKFYIKPTAFKHTGLFPEQSVNWEWLRNIIAKKIRDTEFSKGRSLSEENLSGKDFTSSADPEKTSVSRSSISELPEIEILNLFGYTGGATLACAKAGAKVVHVDSSKSAITWANDNAELSGLSQSKIRWILDDARVFVDREIKRERKYDGIIMDPPAFGHGAQNEIWKIEENLLSLIDNCIKILKDKPLFFLINGYSAGYSAIAYRNILLKIKDKFGGQIEIGELAIEEGNVNNKEKRLLPAGISARWSR